MKLFNAIAAAVMGGSLFAVPTIAHAARCPAGTSKHKIKTGGLLIKRTIAEGCYTDFEAAQLRMQADGMERNRRANVMRNINANRMRSCYGTANTYGSTTYGSATCY